MITREIRAAHAAVARRGTRVEHAAVVARWKDAGGQHWQIDRTLCGVRPGDRLSPAGTPVSCPRCRAAVYRLERAVLAGYHPNLKAALAKAALAKAALAYAHYLTQEARP